MTRPTRQLGPQVAVVDDLDVIDQLDETERGPLGSRFGDMSRRQLLGDGQCVQPRFAGRLGERSATMAAVVETAPFEVGGQRRAQRDDVTQGHRWIDAVVRRGCSGLGGVVVRAGHRHRHGFERDHSDLVGEHLDAVQAVADGVGDRLEYVIVVDLDTGPCDRTAGASHAVESGEIVECRVETRRAVGPIDSQRGLHGRLLSVRRCTRRPGRCRPPGLVQTTLRLNPQ